ncbi:hypothetical protein CHL78_001855 [Romboutsia weinsteinii]|uniref:Phospholipase C/D domain-containing protein n=1 Tax=Romboutsia weinsteinii TaxID=2020949 RepID=A0A371J9M5_9FIRM|nr:zinc dependent phospholipase C family protein [Romboutsia weinsteinii]RDY29470.1 hypothetical protein CHL78_001855 [Romboutsia weinsteinii]
MPRTISHYLFAIDCYDKIEDNNMKNIISNNINLYKFGCQGPNFFNYCNHYSFVNNKNLNLISDLIHNRDINLFFKNMISYSMDNSCIKSIFSNNNLFEVTISYIYGFLSHYILDKNMHPYIYRLQIDLQDQYSKNSRALHKSIETHIDSLLLDKLKNLNPQDFNEHTYLDLSNDELILLCDMYRFLISSVYKKSIIYNDISKCINMFYKTESMLNTHNKVYSRPYLFVKNRTSKTSHIESKIYDNHKHCVNDLSNEDNLTWKNPFTLKDSSSSLLDIYNNSIDEYIKIIKLLNSYLSNQITMNDILIEINDKSYFTNENYKNNYDVKLF